VIERPVLRDRVKDVLLERIASGAYPPGARLVETRIAQELGTSQAPVREALRDLEQLGLVVHEAYRGCSVRAVSAAELLEAFPVRAALEALAARLAAPRIAEADLDRLDALLEEMAAAARAGDALAQSHANAAFHGTIVAAAGNATLVRQWSLLEPFARTYLTVQRARLDLAALADRHRPVVAALRARDGEAAATAMQTHLEEAQRLLAHPATTATEEHAA
jgi:DNA-binding GntR family transcriptional regulator